MREEGHCLRLGRGRGKGGRKEWIGGIFRVRKKLAVVGQMCMCLDSTAGQVLGGCRGAASVAFMLPPVGQGLCQGPMAAATCGTAGLVSPVFCSSLRALPWPQNKFLWVFLYYSSGREIKPSSVLCSSCCSAEVNAAFS